MVLQVYLEGARTAAQLGLSGSDAALSTVNSSAIGIAAQFFDTLPEEFERLGQIVASL